MKLNNEEITDADSQRLSGLEGTQTPSVHKNEQYIFHLTSYKECSF